MTKVCLPKYIMSFFGVLLFLTSVCKADEASKIVSLTNGEWQPFLSRDLPDHGFASSVVVAAFASSGYQVEWTFLPWKRAFNMAQSGEMDGSVVWVKTEERNEDFFFSDPVIVDNEYIYSHVNNPLEWNQIEDLQNYNLALTLHAVYPAIEAEIAAGLIKVERHGGYEKLLPRISHKRADGAILTELVANYFMRQNPKLAMQIYRDNTILYHREYSLIISREITNGAVLISAFNNGLRNIKKDGTYTTLLKRLNGGYYD